MASISIAQQAKEVEIQVNKIIAAYDLDSLPRAERDMVVSLKNQLIDARLDARDYEYAQTRAEQLQSAKEGKKRFEQARETIVKASEYGIFGAIDVAHLSATIQHIMSRMD